MGDLGSSGSREEEEGAVFVGEEEEEEILEPPHSLVCSPSFSLSIALEWGSDRPIVFAHLCLHRRQAHSVIGDTERERRRKKLVSDTASRINKGEVLLTVCFSADL